MKVYAVYIITNDGRPMISKIYQSPDGIPDDTLLSGLLTSIQMVSSELSNQTHAAEKFKMKGVTYHMKNFGLFHIALVTADEDVPGRIMNKIGWQFIQEFGENIPEWDGRMNDFMGFSDNLDGIISTSSIIDISGSIEPSKKLDPVNLLKLAKELKGTAKSLLFLQRAPVIEIANHSETGEKLTQDNLNAMMKMGYIGYFTEGDVKIYFC